MTPKHRVVSATAVLLVHSRLATSNDGRESELDVPRENYAQHAMRFPTCNNRSVKHETGFHSEHPE